MQYKERGSRATSHYSGFYPSLNSTYTLTPDLLDQSQVEDVLIKELIKNLSAEGLKGEVAAVRGLDLKESSLVINDGMHVRRHQSF